METTWITHGKLEVGMTVKTAGNHCIWRNRTAAEQSDRPWRVVAKIARQAHNVFLVFGDGTSEAHAAQAKVLVEL